MIGRTVSHYRVLERLGGGGMGMVYKAEDSALGRAVALKFLAPELTRDEDAKRRFLQEARAASALDHANVCTVYEAGEADDGQMYLAMALYEGETLKQRLERGPLPLEDALEVAAGVARGLVRAHEAGVVHRDIKPGNIMLTSHGEVKILDFGLAKLQDTSRITQQGTTLGTPAYMSPEQIRGEEVGERTDVWSLGVVLHEMLVAQGPFKGGSATAVIYSILHDPPARLAGPSGELPPGVQAVVDRTLVKDPGQRCPNAVTLLADLEALRRGSEPTLSQLRVPARARRRVRTSAVILLAAGVLAATVLLLRPRLAKAPPAGAVGRVVAVLPFTVRGSEEFSYLGDGVVDLLSTKLDGAGDLRSVDPHALLSAVSREGRGPLGLERALPIAERFGAAFYVVGEILEAGGKLHLSASLYARGRREAISKASAEGDAGKIFELVDSLATELIAFELSGTGSRITRIAAVTTDSLPALKSYLQGERELRRGRFGAALDSFEQAVKADESFALAWYRQSVAAEWASRNELAESYAARAVGLAERLSEHDRNLLEAQLARRRGDLTEAERLYRSILRTHADDVEAWLQLGEVLHHQGHLGRSMSTARECWERVLSYDPDNVLASWHLARVASVEGKREELVDLVDRVLRLSPEGDRVLELEAIRAFGLRDEAQQTQVLHKLRSASDYVVALAAWNVAMATDNVAGCRSIAELLTQPARPPDARGLGHVALAHLDLAQGRWRSAKAQLDAAAGPASARALEHRALLSLAPFVPADRAELERLRRTLGSWDASRVPPATSPTNFFSENDDIHPQIRLYLLGAVSARLRDPSAAGHADRLERFPPVDRTPSLLPNLAAGVRAQSLQAEGLTARALELLERVQFHKVPYHHAYASPFFTQPLERYTRAEALREVGRAEEALTWYSSFAEVSVYDLTFLAPSHFRRAQIHEQRGDGAKATEHYRRFLDLWQDADPEFAEWVESARERVVASGPTRAR